MMLLLYAGIFFGMVLLIVGGWTFINRDKLAAAESARAQLQGGIETVDAIEILRDERLSDIPFLNRLLAGRAIAGLLGEVGDRAGQFTHARCEPPAIGRVHGQRGACEHQTAAAEEVKVTGVLTLAHHRRHPHPPCQGMADDPPAGSPHAAHLSEAVAKVTHAAQRLSGQLVIVALEGPGGQLEPAGHVLQHG